MWLRTIICFFSIGVLSINCKLFRLGHSWGGNLGSPRGYKGEPLPKEQWFSQKLDHFNPADDRMWKQRYYVNDAMSNGWKGPIFLMIGGEGPADPRWMVLGTWIDYAKYFGAVCIMLEHRYYGKSHPTSDTSVKNLVYLSSEQALADIANFITFINGHNTNHSYTWIVFGGSYPGSLAAWVRLKYPHLVHGAVSSSGPLLAEVDFQKYFRIVVNALKEKTGDNDCVNKVKEGHREIKMYMKNNPRIIEAEFKVCKTFDNATAYDMMNFYNAIADDFAGLVQYNEDNRISAREETKNITINSICTLLTEPGLEAAFEKLAKFNSIVLEQANQTCMDYDYKKMITDLRNTSWAADFGRQWMYQTCTEFGFYQTSSAAKDVFGNEFTLDFFIQQCQDVFGLKFNKDKVYSGARWTNSMYGALNISASRVVYVHGSVDPWHALGITDTNQVHGDETGVIFIEGTAHCANMYPASERDSAALQEARVEIKRYLRSWLRI